MHSVEEHLIVGSFLAALVVLIFLWNLRSTLIAAIAKDPEKWDHFGLRGIFERARLVGGEARIESKKGRGTRVLIGVPLVRKGAAGHGKN